MPAAGERRAPPLISFLSQGGTLYPGDLIATGNPEDACPKIL